MSTSTLSPTDEQAVQFAVMLQAGLPAEHAILYFVDSEDPGVVALTLQKWLRSRNLAKAQRVLLGKSWQDMTTEEMCDAALEQTYRNMAYLLWSTNYSTANSAEKGKIDTARTALEQRKAGTAGKMDPMWQFIEDFKKDRARKAVQ